MPNGNMMPPSMGAALAPPGGGMPPNQLAKPASPGGDGNFSVEQHVEQGWQQAQQQHKALMESAKRMSVARKQLDSLKVLGDNVQVEDVIRGAGSMVGAGFSPQALAQMLAQMPTQGGQALEAWVAQQDERAQQMDQQLQSKIKDSAIHRGITAMASLHVDHIKDQHQKAQAAMPPMGQSGMGGALAPQGMGPSPQGGDDTDNGEE